MTADIIAAERSLLEAMTGSDLEALDRLLHEDLVFTNHLGMVMSKQADLDDHRSGRLVIDHISVHEQRISLIGDTAVVSLLKTITGHYQGQGFVSTFRFTRVWKSFAPGWKVIAAASVLVNA